MPLQATSGAASYDAFGGGVPVVPNYIEEVFSTYLYAGNESTQAIPNGIDLSTKGGLVWLKARDIALSNWLFDTQRGSSNRISSNSTSAQASASGWINSFDTNGFTLGSNGNVNGKDAGTSVPYNYVSWTFRKQAKFFDIVTWSGDGTGNRAIPHSLGSTPSFITTKHLNGGESWYSYHRSVTSPNANWWRNYGILNGTNAFDDWGDNSGLYQEPDATNLYIGSWYNASGKTYVAYLFAHNAGGFGLTGTDNVISCGSFTTDSGGNATVNLGYEPAWLMFKCSSNAGQNWNMIDTMRGWSLSTDLHLEANSSIAEDPGGYGNPTATGFVMGGQGNTQTYIYIAIRRGPMKVPTLGTSVYNAIARAGTGAVATVTGVGFPPDLLISKIRTSTVGANWSDRLRGSTANLISSSDGAEAISANRVTALGQDGFSLGTASEVNTSGFDYINWNFRRAPSFMDVVCYTGNQTTRTVNHNLAVAPELIITKNRSSAGFTAWLTCVPSIGMNNILSLNTSGAIDTGWSSPFTSTPPTSSVFGLSSGQQRNETGVTYVAYLFATCAGVSKVGSYTGNGTTQTIDCGFGAGGARFVLIKRTDSTGDWYVYDTARGMTVLTDPYLLLNSTAAEAATLGSVTTVSTGFALNSTILAAINVSAGSYIFLAIA
jgi:hypothetical protein